MPSFGDTAIIALIALLLFGPKKLPELARQLGKLMGEFRRASNEFRLQMEDEFRASEQEDKQKKIAAMQAAAPVTPPALQDESTVIDRSDMPEEAPIGEVEPAAENTIADTDAPLPIASSGSLDMMPPASGLPVGRDDSSSPLSSMLESIPHTADPETAAQPPVEQSTHEAVHG